MQLHSIEAAGNYDPRILRQIWMLARRVDPHVMHTWLPQMDVAAGAVALSRHLPWVVAERSSADAYVRRYRDRVLRRVLGSRADAVIANSRAGAEFWEGALLDGARAHVVRNALPLAAISASQPAALDSLGLARAGQPVVVFVGRLAPEKNIGLLLSVATEVCDRLDAVFLICGEGPLRREMERRLRESKSGDTKLLGDRADIWPLMKAANAFVSTSAFEGQPNAVLEAMACGCPLVVSDIPAHREFLDDRTAQLVALTQEEFVRAILRALERRPDIVDRKRAAQERAEQYDVNSAALAYEMIYHEAALRRDRCVE